MSVVEQGQWAEMAHVIESAARLQTQFVLPCTHNYEQNASQQQTSSVQNEAVKRWRLGCVNDAELAILGGKHHTYWYIKQSQKWQVCVGKIGIAY